MSVFDDLSKVPGRFLGLVSFGGLVVIALAIGFVTLFIVHQVSLWISLDPERAFHGAKRLVGVYASGYDTTANIWNAFSEVLLIAIPGWNAGVEYVVQPLVFSALDVLSIAFTHQPYGGVITEEQVPFEGFVCPQDGSLDKASEWCGKLSFYSSQLGVASGSTSSFVGNSSVTLSTQTARRLSEVTGNPVVGVLDLSMLVDAIQSLLGAGIVLVGTLSDVVFHVAWTVLSEVFETLFNLFIMAIKSLAGAVMMLVRSGVLTTVIKLGMDLLIVLLTDIVIPYFLAYIQAIMCIIDYTQVAGWMTQMDCSKFSPCLALHTPLSVVHLTTACVRLAVERTCFQEGSDVFGEVFHTFSSIPHIAYAIQGVFMKLTNQNTGQRYGSSASGGIDAPEVDAGSTETPRTHVCGQCFNCQVRAQPPPRPPQPATHTHLLQMVEYSTVQPTPTADTRAACHLHVTGHHLRVCARRGEVPRARGARVSNGRTRLHRHVRAPRLHAGPHVGLGVADHVHAPPSLQRHHAAALRRQV
jgi:hypothetical protein